MIDAAIFDLDGTLVDTMPLHYEAYRRAFATVDLDLPREVFFGAVGGTAREVVPRLIGERPCPVSVEVLHGRKKAELDDLLATASITRLETSKLVDALDGRLPLGLATSGSRRGVVLMLERLGWASTFGAVVTGEDVRHGKPHPEPFLLAAERLGVGPSRCLAFEDTDAGVASALAAGMQVFDVRRASVPC